MENCITRIKELERLFSDNQYNGSGQTAFFIEEGNIPIMVSAPHAINQFREGRVNWADVYTGGIARYLHEVTGCHLICSSMFTESDPNFDLPGTNKYQDALVDYLGTHKIVVLLDLHGAAKNREYAVEMGTAPKQNPETGVEYEQDPSLHEYKFIAELIKKLFEKNFVECTTDKKKCMEKSDFYCGGSKYSDKVYFREYKYCMYSARNQWDL